MNYSHLFSLLKRVGWITLVAEGVRTFLLAGGLLLVLALAAVLVDVFLALPVWALLLIDVVVAALFVGCAAYGLIGVFRQFYDPRRLARRIEVQLGIEDSRLINAVEFSVNQGNQSAVSDALRHEAIERGETLAATVSARRAIDFRPLKFAAATVGGGLLLAVLFFFVAPSVFVQVLPRFLDPTGDHPPFTLVRFDVQVEPQPVYYGHAATIHVRLGGPFPLQQADVVFVADATQEAQRVPMMHGEEQSFVTHIDRAEHTRLFYIDTPEGRSRRFRLNVAAVPTLETASVEYRYPAYTNWPGGRVTLNGNEIRALEGTNVVVRAESNLPLKNGRLEIHQDDEESPTTIIELSPTADTKTVEGEFELRHNGRYRLTVTGVGGAECHNPIEGAIAVVADRPPQIAIVEPEARAMAVEGWKVPVKLAARDDVAIGRVELLAGVNGWGPSPLELSQYSGDTASMQAQYEFDLKKLGVQAGDILSYYGSAHDTRAGRPQLTDTPTHVIHVISLEQYQELARSQYRIEDILQKFERTQRELKQLGKQREELLQKLDKLQQQTFRDGLTAEQKEQMEKLKSQLQQFAEQTQALANQLQEQADQPPVYDFEKSFQDMLSKLSDQLHQQSEAARKTAQSAQQLSQQLGQDAGKETEESSAASKIAEQDFKQAVERFNKQQDPFGSPGEQTPSPLEQTARDLETLDKADQLLAEARRMSSIIRQQRDLADRMGQFRNQSNLSPQHQQRLEKLAKEQDLLRQELEETVRRLQEKADAARDALPQMSKSADGICQAVSEMKIPADQQSASKAGRQGQGNHAFDMADQAAEKLASLASKSKDCNCQGAAQEMSVDRPLSLSQEGLQQALNQLAQGRGPPQMPQLGSKQRGGKSGNRAGGSHGGHEASQQTGNETGGQAGESDRGFQGSRANWSVFGPHTAAQTARARRAESGRFSGNDASGAPSGSGLFVPGSAAESLVPGSQSGRVSGGANLRGVPAPFRSQAEAYFRRLAEEGENE